jgi:protein arginine kinase
MRFTTLMRQPADWMAGKGGDNSVVLTSRIRLARNLDGEPFPGWAPKSRRQGIFKKLRGAVESLPVMKDGFSQELGTLEAVRKQVLVERHLISRELAARGAACGVVVDRRQNFSFLLNEEDHLRMQAIRTGLALEDAFAAIDKQDDALAGRLDFAFDAQFGYLTACPTNLGTGLRASVMLHLPGLVLSDLAGKVLNGVGKLGLAVRGIYGEGSESLGNLFQISNQSTLGESEAEIIRRLGRVAADIAGHERNAREKLFEEAPGMVSDRVGRAYGVLRHAWMIETKEALQHLSMLRLGGDLGVLGPETVACCDALLLEIQPAHLQFLSGGNLTPEKRDAIRAEMIRSRLQSLQAPVTHRADEAGGEPPEDDNIPEP